MVPLQKLVHATGAYFRKAGHACAMDEKKDFLENLLNSNMNPAPQTTYKFKVSARGKCPKEFKRSLGAGPARNK